MPGVELKAGARTRANVALCYSWGDVRVCLQSQEQGRFRQIFVAVVLFEALLGMVAAFGDILARWE